MSILVTGAANGLGRAIAELFLKKGQNVVAVDKEEISYTHNNLISYRADITDCNALVDLRQDLDEQAISISIVVNNAGFFRFFPISDSKPEELESIFKLNAFAPINVINTFRDHLIANKGRVIQISSENVKLSGPFQPYPSSKIALESLSTAARQELLLVGVKLIIVRPGAIETSLLNWNSPESGVYGRFLQKFLKQAQEKMSKVAAPSTVANLVFRAASTPNPRKFYNINHNRWLSIFSKLPEGLRERIILRMLK